MPPNDFSSDDGLADLDVLGDTEELKQQADALLRDSEQERAEGRYRGVDDTRSIFLAVDRRSRLVELDISRTWRDRLAPERFGGALLATYTAASQRALVNEVAARQAEPAVEPAPEPDVYREVDDHEWLRGVEASLDEVEAQLNAAARQAATGEAPPDVEVRSPNGYLTLRLRAGAPVGIGANAKAIALAGPDRLREDVLAAFRQAGLAPRKGEDEDNKFF